MRHFVLCVLMVPSLVGCGGSATTVSGTVKCSGKAVVGLILFSPVAKEGEINAGESVSADLDAEGRYEAALVSPGKYRIVITPNDVQANPKPGTFDYPCVRTPIEKDFAAGRNEFSIEMPKRTK
jgi:hypothetical protein